ncbi:transposase [Acaryochloris sp. CCMEE 5410]|uniref:IS701 family transposase n=1 Tax=Acaryochloris sp. CCMEE 5410 TaxID=310037 RepID=UPI0021D1541B|nr:transposase [Acaryochloris sp. CCMEE 5410]
MPKGVVILKSIIHPDQALKQYLSHLSIPLSKPQQQHVLRIVEGLIVGNGRKTLSHLYAQWVDAPDASAVADFLRVSTWSEQSLDKRLGEINLADVIERVQRGGSSPVVYVSIDDSTSSKDKDTHALEGVDWQHDHNASGRNTPKYKKGMVHVSCRVQIGNHSVPFAYRLYLRAKTVRNLNRGRAKEERLRFQTKYQLVREMLQQLQPLLPKEWRVYVLFDSWYASAKLLKFVRRQGKRWFCLGAIKSNRILDGKRLSQWNKDLKHKHYDSVELKTVTGSKHTYLTRSITGRLNEVPFDVCVVISKRHPRDSHPKYYLCTDTSLSAAKILKRYSKRWSIETDYWYLKQCLGLGEFRVQHYEAIHKWYSLVHLALHFCMLNCAVLNRGMIHSFQLPK